MCIINTHDDNEFSVEIDTAVYNQDFDEAYPGEEEVTQTETDILFE